MTATRINSKRGQLFHYTEDSQWSPGNTKTLGKCESWALYAIVPQGGLSVMLGVAMPNSNGGWTIRAGGVYDNGTNQVVNGMTFTVSSAGVWTYSSGGYITHTASGNHGARTAQNVGFVVRLA